WSAAMRLIVLAAIALLYCGAASAQATLRVGAVKVDVTPRGESLPSPFLDILDPLHVRAIVLDDGTRRGALVSVDAGAVGAATWDHVTKQAERELGIAPELLMLTATHTHSAPFGRDETFAEAIVEALAQAAAAL